MQYAIHQRAGGDFRPFSPDRAYRLADYPCTYSGTISAQADPQAMLEDLFRMFNMNHPADFESHSLSIGDLVMLDGTRLYCCDSIGWRQVTGGWE